MQISTTFAKVTMPYKRQLPAVSAAYLAGGLAHHRARGSISLRDCLGEAAARRLIKVTTQATEETRTRHLSLRR